MSVQVQPGDYIIRGDQPYRTLADMYFSVQNFSPSNPRPYDDTGWTFPYMRNIVVKTVTEKSILDQHGDAGYGRREGYRRRSREPVRSSSSITRPTTTW